MKKSELKTDKELIFEFNAMLMFGWVADKDRKIHIVNASLEKWLELHLGHVLQEIDSDAGMSIERFLEQTLDTEGAVRNEIIRCLDDVPQRMNTIQGQNSKLYYKDGAVEIKYEVSHAQDSLLVGVRAVAVTGIAMIKGDVEDRVDLIIVCQTQLSHGIWSVIGYQGQLQSAWLRVEPIFRASTRSGAVALMARNLSHNIGSHALYWLEQEATSDLKSREQGLFLKYLRERMELIAGFATSVPLSPRTIRFSRLLSGFSENRVFTKLLCKSEGRTSINIVREGRPSQSVAVPGGAVGMQAFYSLLENIIRDSAKYDHHTGEMTVKISLNAVEGKLGDDYFRINVRVEGSSKAEKAAKIIREALADLRIADESGKLNPDFWGIKERFIAAAMLRGVKVEDIGFTEEVDGEQKANWNLARHQPSDANILDVRVDDDALVWEFYLLKPKDVLIITDERLQYTPPEGVGVQDAEWLRKNIDRATTIRHPFVVLIPSKIEDLKWMYEKRTALPVRTFLGGEFCTPEALRDGALARLDETLALDQRFNPDTLYRQWLLSIRPDLNDKFIVLKTADDKRCYEVEWSGNEPKSFALKDMKKRFEDPRCLGLFHRHWDTDESCKPFDLPLNGSYWEVYEGNDSLQSVVEHNPFTENDKHMLFESTLLRVLIVDERLDKVADATVKESGAQGITIRQRFAAKGVTIHGSEFSGDNIPGRERLVDGWAKEHGANYYHFICVHRGILDKLDKIKGDSPNDICNCLKKLSPNVLLHSGRVGINDLPEGIKFVPLSSVSSWLDKGRGKLDILDELCLVRRTE